MKPSRLNKVIGLALGEQSALVAEVASAGTGQPEVRQVAEFAYPAGLTPAQQPAELGAALAAFLREGKFTARHAVVGLPAKWLVAKPKDVPPADPATLTELLRLGAEGEFSAEHRGLVYDYAADATAGQPKQVLLIATPQRYVDAAVTLCEAAKLTAAGVTPSVVALGAATAMAGGTSPLVLTVGTGGAELTAQAGAAPSAIRHLRGIAGAADNKPFLGELRRTLSTLPLAIGSTRAMVLWGTDDEVSAVNDGNLGFSVTAGDLPALGVAANGSAAANGDGRRYAAPVALALSAIGANRRAVDFLHPRLAAPEVRRVPRWVVPAALAAVVLVAAGVYANNVRRTRQAALDDLTAKLDRNQDAVATATAFVNKVSFAQGWHGGTPRYLACLRDLDNALPQDGQTYATNLSLREPPRATGASAVTPKPGETVALAGRLEGKTSDVIRAQQAVDKIKAVPGFANVQLANETTNGKDREVSFSVSFTYNPPKPAAAPRPTAAGKTASAE